jgi:hypothetical protein
VTPHDVKPNATPDEAVLIQSIIDENPDKTAAELLMCFGVLMMLGGIPVK